MNLGGSHDQAQNQAESYDSLNRPKDRQGRVSQAHGARIIPISRARACRKSNPAILVM
jgi:hypothetical protein